MKKRKGWIIDMLDGNTFILLDSEYSMVSPWIIAHGWTKTRIIYVS